LIFFFNLSAAATEQEIASHYNLLQLLGQSVSKKSYVEAAVPELQALPVAPDLGTASFQLG